MQLAKRQSAAILVSVATLGFVVFGYVIAEKFAKTNKDNVPASVLAAFQKQYPNAKITGVEKEKKNGQTYYEIESKDGKAERDILYSADGKIFEIEEEISVTSLPQRVREAVNKAYPGGEIDEAEKITRGSTVEYEVVVEVGDEEFEVLVAADGKLISKEQIADEEEADDDDRNDDDEEENDE